jgi:hypothetical protein
MPALPRYQANFFSPVASATKTNIGNQLLFRLAYEKWLYDF